MVKDYIQNRKGVPGLFSFEYNLLPKLISIFCITWTRHECKGCKRYCSDPHDFIGELPAYLFWLFVKFLSFFSEKNPYWKSKVSLLFTKEFIPALLTPFWGIQAWIFMLMLSKIQLVIGNLVLSKIFV